MGVEDGGTLVSLSVLAAVVAMVDVAGPGVAPGKSSCGRAALGVAMRSVLAAVASVPLRRSAEVKAEAEVPPVEEAGVAIVDAVDV